jgi:hypothetical protein
MDHLNKDTEFDTGLNFKSLYEFKEAIREWSVLNNREIKCVKNDNDRVRIVCKKDCGFLVHCSRVGRKQTFKIKTWFGTHNCPKVLNNRSATSKWVAKSVLKKMMVTDNVKVTDIMVDMRRNHSVGISFYRAWKAKLKAKEILEGHASKQYTLLWRYAAELNRVSRRNTCKIDVERTLITPQPRFKSFYFCLEGRKRGFLTSCRPFIGVDGCHLKTKHGGILLIAVGRDANDQYYPLAFGVVENETKDSWRWFLTLLLEDIGREKRWVFISDQQKVLNCKYHSINIVS